MKCTEYIKVFTDLTARQPNFRVNIGTKSASIPYPFKCKEGVNKLWCSQFNKCLAELTVMATAADNGQFVWKCRECGVWVNDDYDFTHDCTYS